MQYRKYEIRHNPKPIPSAAFDWDYCHIDYNGPGDPRCGSAASVEQAKQEIDDIEDAEDE